jgi:hypothetical protein
MRGRNHGGKRSGAGRKPAQPISIALDGMSPHEAAKLVLLRMVTGEIPATSARVVACRETLRLSKHDDVAPLCKSSADNWSSILGRQ